MARDGANVVINARSNEAEARGVEKEAQALGAKTLVVMGTAGELATVEELKRRSYETFGHVDIYVSNAARRLHKSFFETSNEDWHFFLNQQLTASWYLAKAFTPAMVELTAVVAFANMSTRSNTAMGIESQGFSKACKLPLARATSGYATSA